MAFGANLLEVCALEMVLVKDVPYKVVLKCSNIFEP